MSKTTDFLTMFADLQDKVVKVGWLPGNEYADTGTPVAQVAAWMEFGAQRTLKNGKTVTIPARAPMRTNQMKNQAKMADDLGKAIRMGIRTGDMDRALNNFGMVTVSDLQATINSSLPPPNAESTVHGMEYRDKDGNIKRRGSAPRDARKFGQGKGFNNPLIDSGQMMKTVTYSVE